MEKAFKSELKNRSKAGSGSDYQLRFEPLNIDNMIRLPYPSNMILDIHSYCNASCKVCPYPHLSKMLPMGRMEDWLFKKIVDEFTLIAKKYPIRAHIIFCNMGEPFVVPDIFDKIRYVLEGGLNLVIQTNAYLLTPEKIRELISTGFKGSIYISCHGITPDVYRRVMGLDIKKTLRNIDFLIDNYPKKMIQVRAIAYDWPFGEAFKVKRYWKERGVSVKIFLPNSRTGLVFNCISWRLKYPGNKLKGCKKTLPIRDMVVAFNGDAVLCCEDMGRKVILGNLRDNSIQDVWNSEAAKDILEKIFLGKKSDDNFICKTCEFGRSTLFKRFIKSLDNEWHRFWKCHF